MARGKKTDTETIYKVMASWFVTGNYQETARQLDMPLSTVLGIVKSNRDKKEFAELRHKKVEEFTERASRIIDKALARLENEIETAEVLPINQLSTVIGTLYDKRALANGESTANEYVKIGVSYD